MLPWFPRYGWVLLAVAVALTLAFALWARALFVLHRWREAHHFTWGALLCIAGMILVAHGRLWGGLACCLLGLWWAWDDAVAHHRQARDPTFPRSGPRGWLDYKYSQWHRWAHRVGLI